MYLEFGEVMASSFNITDASVQNLFKRQYKDKSLNTYNGKVPVLGLVKKSFDLVGLQREMEVPTGYQGGAGSGSLPTANRGIYVKPVVTSKSIYCVCEVDRRTIKLAKNEGAFVDSLKESVRKTVEKFNWNVSRMLFNTLANGSLGTIDSVTDNGGGEYAIVITSATWKLANWEIRDFVNIESGNTDLFEITAVAVSTRTITVKRISGSQVPAGSDVVFLQGSESNDITSFAATVAATTSTSYGVTVGYRWQAPVQKTASSANISADLMNEGMLGVEEACGITPNLIVTSYIQLRKLLNSMEDQKFYSLTPSQLAPRADNLKGVVSFPSVQFMSTAGPVSIVVDKFCDSDKMYFCNTDNMELLHAPDQGWFDDEGFVFLRKAGADAYEARYGAYMENYSPASVAGYLYSLSVAG